ncbi:unnamed protein product [Gordionus sp. m RMFG-2023]
MLTLEEALEVKNSTRAYSDHHPIPIYDLDEANIPRASNTSELGEVHAHVPIPTSRITRATTSSSLLDMSSWQDDTILHNETDTDENNLYMDIQLNEEDINYDDCILD